MTNPNFEPTEVPLAQVEGAYLELEAHNREHTGMGKAMAGFLLGLIHEPGGLVENEDGIVEPNLHIIDTTQVKKDLTDVDKGEMSEDLLGFTTDPVFEAMGLKRVAAGTVNVGDTPIQSAGQDLVIVQPTRYVDLLERAKGNLEEHPGLKRLIENTYIKTLGVIEQTARPSIEVSDEVRAEGQKVFVDILERIQPAVTELAASDNLNVDLGLGTAYLNWGNRPEFSDFLLARQNGLREGNTFSASEWHLDASAEFYNSKWEAVLSHYDKVVAKWGADSDLALLMRGQMTDAIETAEKWLHDGGHKGNNVYTNNLRQPIQNVAEQITKRLA